MVNNWCVTKPLTLGIMITGWQKTIPLQSPGIEPTRDLINKNCVRKRIQREEDHKMSVFVSSSLARQLEIIH
jgi:hypothetical protein